MTRTPTNQLRATVFSQIPEREAPPITQHGERLSFPASAGGMCLTLTPPSAVAPVARTAATIRGATIVAERTTSGSGSRRGCGRISARDRCSIHIPVSVDSRRPDGLTFRRSRSRQKQSSFRLPRVNKSSSSSHNSLRGISNDERRSSPQVAAWAKSPSHDSRVTEPLGAARILPASWPSRFTATADACAGESAWRNCFHPCMFRRLIGTWLYARARPVVSGAPIRRPIFATDGTPCALPDRVAGAHGPPRLKSSDCYLQWTHGPADC